jgi:fumarate hydratase subunit beta
MERRRLETPISLEVARSLKVGDAFEIHGSILCGRDAVLPKLVELAAQNRLGDLASHLEGSVIFHTAVSPAGIGPTSSNKVEIESSIAPLSKVGVRIHLGKGAIGAETVKGMCESGSAFAVTPPATALFMDKIVWQRVLAFPEEGMEALYEVRVKGMPGIVVAARDESVF